MENSRVLSESVADYRYMAGRLRQVRGDEKTCRNDRMIIDCDIAGPASKNEPTRMKDYVDHAVQPEVSVAAEQLLSWIRHGRIRGTGVPACGTSIGRAGFIPPETITNSMYWHGSRIYQERPDGQAHIPYYKSIFLPLDDVKACLGLTLEKRPSKPPSGQRGRPKGSGKIRSDDNLFPEIMRLVESKEARSVPAAVQQVAPIEPTVQRESTVKRISQKFREWSGGGPA